MSNAMNTRPTTRWQLLSTVSALALLASAYGAGEAEAAGNDSDRPLIWIELGGQLEGLSSPQEAFDPPFMASITQANLLSAMDVQRPPAYALGEDGKISFQPEDSNWVFSASVRYGRSSASRHHHQQTKNPYAPVAPFNLPPSFGSKYINIGTKYPNNHVKFADGRASQSEAHTILDFQAGKDVGLGMFGQRGSSVLSAGVRFAQFSSKASVNLRAEPDVQYPSPTKPLNFFTNFRSQFKYVPMHVHNYEAAANSQRDFRGVGPSVAWNASLPFAGNPDAGELTLDWGVNAAVLFGRQKATGHHQSTTRNYYGSQWHLHDARTGVPDSPGKHIVSGYFIPRGYSQGQLPPSHTTDFNRVRSVTVPNLGGFAGLSVRYSDVKFSVGYRADFFFGAIDGGIDARKSENRGFYGPFASISFGLGD
jgi:iron complex outermembrane recepter protein